MLVTSSWRPLEPATSLSPVEAVAAHREHGPGEERDPDRRQLLGPRSRTMITEMTGLSSSASGSGGP